MKKPSSSLILLISNGKEKEFIVTVVQPQINEETPSTPKRTQMPPPPDPDPFLMSMTTNNQSEEIKI
jgi:hypothetical protein